MKFLLLHGTSGDHTSNWLPWLKGELESDGHQVRVPDLPDADTPNVDKYWNHLSNQDWDFSDNVIIGHSSGSVAILGILEKLPAETKINTAILVGAFTKRLSESPSWSMLQQLFKNDFDFESIKTKSNKFIFIHSKDDPICPIDQARYLSEQSGGEMIEFEDKGHFTVRSDPSFTKFPEILDIIKEKVL